MTEMERQLSDLLKVAAGEPPHRVTVGAVRRAVVKRRVIASATTAAAIALIGGAGAAASAAFPHPAGGSPSPAGPAPGVPRYYVAQSSQGLGSGRSMTAVRARATGAVTAKVGCPGTGTRTVLWPVATAGGQTYFMACQHYVKRGTRYVIAGSRIYRFQVTTAGQVRGYAQVRGGELPGLGVGALAVTASGSEVAVYVTRSPPAPVTIFVISTATGARAIWRQGPAVPGTLKYSVNDLSLTGNGRELIFFGRTRCVKSKTVRKCAPSGGAQARALAPANRGGLLSDSRPLMRQSSVVSLSNGYINDAVITPDGSALTVGAVDSGRTADSTFVEVVRVSTATGRPVRVLYRLNTGNGFSYGFVRVDASGRYVLFDAGPAAGPAVNGWIRNGHLVPLKPAGDNVFLEAW